MRTCASSRPCLWPRLLYDLREERRGVTDLQVDITTPIWGFFQNLTCELSQDLLDGDTAGERVAVGAVGGDQVIGGVDGSLDTCSTRFL